MEKRIKWHLEVKPLSDLKPHPKNPRIITSDQLKIMGDSLDDIGLAQPININTDGTILSGHARYYKLKEEGATEVDCYVPDRTLTPKQEEAVIIRMNKNIIGTWDWDMLANEFELEDLLTLGFTDSDLVQITDIPDLDPDEGKGEDENKKYLLEIKFNNELDMRDLYDDLTSKGYSVRTKS